ncbi:uncharacterized protein EI90DRAFT_3136285 [Cantharellus anzutake]|uniref:uncharacterized protein n=1 Tax=Cantharellus anzutake TaxID=1750568 RepID=UPI001905BAC8|nr:uncharacterized protein EI90DRAFT_3136285 [Cantharellus anzutake]KAF8314122.1 hypothetical protein EI90DRAFT_3136285 [Cantharellus anzutake]
MSPLDKGWTLALRFISVRDECCHPHTWLPWHWERGLAFSQSSAWVINPSSQVLYGLIMVDHSVPQTIQPLIDASQHHHQLTMPLVAINVDDFSKLISSPTLSLSTLTSTFGPNITPHTTLLLSLPIHPSPTLPPSSLIFTFRPDLIPPLTSPSRSSPHSSPSITLPSNLHQVTTFHRSPVPCTRTLPIPSLQDSIMFPTSDFDSTSA